MSLNKKIPNVRRIKLLVLDSDGVCMPRGTKIKEKEGRDRFEIEMRTNTITPDFSSKLASLSRRIQVVVSSGRTLLYLRSMYGRFSTVDIMAENGSIFLKDNKKIISLFEPDDSYLVKIAKIREEMKKLPVTFEPKQFILTAHSEEEHKEVYEIVKKYDPQGALRVMWNGEAFDIQDKSISKGAGLKKLMELQGLSPREVVAIGDRVNDREMVELAGIGVSADQKVLPAEYFTVGEGLPGEQLVDYLLAEFKGL